MSHTLTATEVNALIARFRDGATAITRSIVATRRAREHIATVKRSIRGRNFDARRWPSTSGMPARSAPTKLDWANLLEGLPSLAMRFRMSNSPAARQRRWSGWTV
jgi:hypothetical protein